MSSPSISLNEELSYSLRRQHVDEFLSRAFEGLRADELIVDFGGVKADRRGKFNLAETGARIITLNIVASKPIDVHGDAARVPLQSQCASQILCSEVLEHVEDPGAVVREALRVLKADGRFVATVPFLFRQHADPVDVGRYTQWHWRQLLERIGFVDVHISKQGLFWSVAVDMLRDWFRYLLTSNIVHSRIGLLIFPRLVRCARKFARAREDRPGSDEHDFFGRYPGGFGIIAFKPQKR